MLGVAGGNVAPVGGTSGGAGVFSGASLSNYGTIIGGGAGIGTGSNGAGGTGVADENGGTLTNNGVIESGAGGGVGVYLSDAILVNNGTINGEGSAAVQFARGDSTLAFGQSAVFDGAITGFAMGDTLVADGMVFNSATYVSGVGLELFGAGGEVTLDLPVNYSGDFFSLTANGDNTTIRLATDIGTISTAVTTQVTAGAGHYLATLTVAGSGSVSPPPMARPRWWPAPASAC